MTAIHGKWLSKENKVKDNGWSMLYHNLQNIADYRPKRNCAAAFTVSAVCLRLLKGKPRSPVTPKPAIKEGLGRLIWVNRYNFR